MLLCRQARQTASENSLSQYFAAGVQMVTLIYDPWRRNPGFASSERKGVVMSCKVISICEGACRSFQNRLEAFRRELPPGTMRLLLRRVLACRRCLQELRGRQPAVLHCETPPPELASRITDRIREEAERVTPHSHSKKSFDEEGA
jgi:hypothetical protein